jgi:septum formation protein
MLPLTRPLLLASNSPRRQQLLRDLGFDFTVSIRPTDELFPAKLPVEEVAEYLARQKAAEFISDCKDKLVLCADTVVVVDNTVLNKPANAQEAASMLKLLSGKRHRVITGLALLDSDTIHSTSDTAIVYFKNLSDSEIEYYIHNFRPYDKAGAYGIQEWIGMIGIEKIEGSYYTIMGLPTHRVYEYLLPYQLQ